MPAVEINEVTKTFGPHVAVDKLSLQVPEGTIYGFIGPNGSGKTTTLRMIMRIFHPDSGNIRVLGEDATNSSAANESVAYLPEERGLYKQMKVKEVLKFYAQIKGMRHPEAEIADWLERLGLSAWADKKIQALSKGMSQKVQFIATVISRPKLVLLDEPFSGLDPVNGAVLRDAVISLRQSGSTVIFSTHDMGVAEKLCDSIFMIYKGKKVLDGTLEEIQDSYGEDTIRVRLGSDGGATLGGLPGVSRIADFGRYQELKLERDANAQEILASLMNRGEVRHFELSRPSLLDIFVRIAGADAYELQPETSHV